METIQSLKQEIINGGIQLQELLKYGDAIKTIWINGQCYALGFRNGSYYYCHSGLECDEYGAFKHEQVSFKSSDPYINKISSGE